MMVAISGVRPDTPFWDKLEKDECKTLAEFYSRADMIMRLETAREAIQERKETAAEKGSDNGKSKRMETIIHLWRRRIRSQRLQT